VNVLNALNVYFLLISPTARFFSFIAAKLYRA